MKTMTKALGTTLVFFLAAITALSVLFGAKESAMQSADVESALRFAAGDKVTIMDNGVSDFEVLVIGSVKHANANQTASELENFFYRYSNNIMFEKASSKTPTTNVVTYGRVSNIPLTVTLADDIDSRPETSFVWGVAYENGVLALYANSKSAINAPISKTLSGKDLFTDLYYALSELISEGKLIVTEGMYRVFEITEEDYAAIVAADEKQYEAEEDERRLLAIEQLKNQINSFNSEDFGTPETGNTLTKDFGTAASGSPHYYPTEGAHPRVLFTADDVPGIRARIESLVGSEEYKQFMQYLEEDVTGILPPAKKDGRGFHNWDGKVLSRIQANALGYAIYGDELYGYKAIYAMKNFLLTLDVDCIVSDQCREFGMVMYIAACVYDWCYDLLSEDDMYQIALGVEHKLCRGSVKNTQGLILSTSSPVKMEMGFPPASQSAATGHGAEFQLQRDYLAMAIAVYDELPSWYEFVGGRFYNEYIPIYSAYSSAGLYPQGMSCYAPWRFLAVCYGGALIQAATGRAPYSTDIAQIVYTFLSNETANNGMFSTGDGASTSLPTAAIRNEALVISHMLYDTHVAPLLRLIEDEMGGNYTGVSVSTVLMSEYFIFTAREVDGLDDTTWRNELPLVNYTGDYVGQYLARNEWTDNAAVVMMRMSVRPTGNHDHRDAGTFQIYYKGLTTGSSGGYSNYGSDHWGYYHQATVSHNGILIFDPSKADTVPQLITNADGSPKVDSYGNVSYSNETRLFYSGEQKKMSTAGTLEQWMNSGNLRAEVIGFSDGYAADGTSPKYAYIAGDITASYETSQASYVGRTMLTVYTGDEDYPMVFFVFDNIDAAKDDIVKKFLLQINGSNAPVIDEENKTVIVEESNGQLVLQNVLGADKIEGLGGGYGYNYLINGVNCQDNSFSKQNSWGRVEVSASGADSSLMLNVIYVSDAGNKEILEATSVKGTDTKTGKRVMLEGATIGNVTALFSTEFDRTVEEISFTAEGEGVMSYFIGGLFEGTWRVSFDGEYVGTVYSTHNSGMISFKAPAGADITISPGSDIRPAGSEKLTFITNGGVINGDVPSFYLPGESKKLPTNITRGLDIFEGWYLDKEFTKPITEIPADSEGALIVYAKWASIFANEDYSSTYISVENKTAGSASGNGVSYNISDGAFTTYRTEEKDGAKYLFWQTLPNPDATSNEGKNGRGPSLFVNASTSSIATMSGEQITYIFKFMDAGTEDDMTVNVRVRNADKKETSFFNISGGKVKFDGQEIATLSENKFTTVSVVLDFAKGEVRLYTSTSHDEYKKSVSLPERTTFTSELLSMRSSSKGAIKIGLIQVYEGDKGAIIKGSEVPENYIEFPPEAILPDGTSLSFTPNGGTVIPTEGITAIIGGVKHELDGWYSDAALTSPVVTVPDGVSEKFVVYAKWREANVVYFPDEANLPEMDYVPGVTELPVGISGVQDNYTVTLEGWYLDADLTQPITKIPENASGAFYPYAKWNEPNYIKYPDGVVLPDDAPTEYESGVATPLPESVTNKTGAEFIFLGWYSDAELTERIYEVPANASGRFAVYAKWQVSVMNFDPDSETSGGPVIGYGYCAVHSDTNTDGICDTCKYCVKPCSDKDGDKKCDTCGFANWCGNSADKHADADGDKRCDSCNVYLAAASLGTINGLSFGFSEYVAGSMSVVENGDDDYVKLHVRSGNGPAFNYGGALSIYSALKDSAKHQLVLQLDIAAEEGEALMPFNLRIRKDGSAVAILSVGSDGSVGVYGGAKIDGLNITTDMTTISIALDFDKGEIRYYAGESIDPVAKVALEKPVIYSTVEEWLKNSFNVAAYGVMQNRIQGAGTLLIGGVRIFTDEDGAFDESNNKIMYPEGITLPSDAPKSYIPGVTALPTDVSLSTGGIQLELEGWYSDAALTNRITKIPADAEGEYCVYAKWVEKNVIVYPGNVIAGENFPVEYTPGVTLLPTDVQYNGKYSGKFVGWYLDEACTKKISVVPADASGILKVYALFDEYIFNLIDIQASESTGAISGYGYCATGHTDADENGVCDECLYCVTLCTDTNSDSKCDVCGYKPSRCSNSATGHVDSDANNRCDVCNINFKTANVGSLGLPSVSTSFAEYVAGYAKVVENGDNDYIEIFTRNDNGPTFNYSGSESINTFLSDKHNNRIVYTLELARDENTAVLPIGLRARVTGSTAMIFSVSADGSTTVPGYSLGTEMTKFIIVVDFDAEEIRYYVNDLIDPVITKPFTRPAAYATTEEWLATDYKNGTNNVFQLRYGGAGLIRIGGISVGNDTGRYDIRNNKIIYPEEAELPLGAPKSFIAGETVLPTDVTAIKGGVIHELEGWYSDAALTQRITVIPEGAEGEYRVYANWVEKNYVIYPVEANIPDSAVVEYTPGISEIPLPISGVTGTLHGKTVTLAGWYLDEELTQPTSVIPESASGAFRVYAKWNEPNVITYPTSVKTDASFPEDYVAGETALPENPQYNGSGEATFVGWYADEACTKKITVIPADASGVFHVYAVFSKTLLDLDVQAGTETGTVVGYNYCEHTDADTDGKCDECGRCVAGCADGNADHNCDTCGKCICSFASNGLCSYCRTNKQTGSLGLTGVNPNFSDNAPGYVAVVENGDSDYVELHVEKEGPQYNYNGADSINTALNGMDRHVLVYSFEIGAKEGEAIMNAQFRFRPNNTATEFFSVKTDGTLSNCGGAKISTDSLTRVTVVVDFDNEIIKYYLGDSTEAVGTKAWTKPSQFATVDEWLASYYTIGTYGVLQVRMSSAGTILIGDISIKVNDPKYI